MEALGAALASHSPIVLGASNCRFSAKFKDDFKNLLGDGEGQISYLNCDESPEAKEYCSRMGVKMTPTILVGGESLSGYDRKSLTELLDRSTTITSKLAERGATLYGKAESCPWTRRQQQVLGSSELQRLAYVDCEATAAGKQKCKEAGIAAVPAWRVGSSTSSTGSSSSSSSSSSAAALSPPIYGYMRLAQLNELAGMSAEQVEERARQTGKAVKEGKAAACSLN